MSPIPVELGANIFKQTDLKGPEFMTMVSAVDDLIHRRKELVRPPSDRVELNEGLSFSMPYMYVIDGNPRPSYLNFLFEQDVIPCSHYQVDHDTTLHDVFGIRLQFDKEEQHVIVSRRKSKVKLQHENGSLHGLSLNDRYALLGLSLLPDELWTLVPEKGFIFGSLTGGYWDNPWRAKSWSLSLPDPDAKLGWRNTQPQVLRNFEPQSLARQLNPDPRSNIDTGRLKIIGAYMKKLQPVGVFFDYRTSAST